MFVKKRFTCMNCGQRTHKKRSETLINTKETIRCPICGSKMPLVSIEDLTMKEDVYVEKIGIEG